MEKDELKEIFDYYDRDKNGIIDEEEFGRLIQVGLEAEMSSEELDMGFKEIDKDKNGTIEFDEFVVWWNDR